MNAKLVIRIGRSRSLQASTAASKPIAALLLALLGEFDDKDGVFASEPHEHNETDLGEDVVIHAAQPDSGERRQHAHRHDENDAQG